MWGQYDSKGSKGPVGDVCRVHKLTMELAYPADSQQHLAGKFHEKNEEGKLFRVEFLAASAVMGQLLSQGHLPNFLPMSTIAVQKDYSVMSFYDLVVLQEADLLRIFKSSAKSLRVKMVPIELEDGSGTIKGCYLNPTGMPLELVAGLRHVRISSTLTHKRVDELVNPQCTVRQGQAQAVHDLSVQRMAGDRRRSLGRARAVAEVSRKDTYKRDWSL